MLMMFDFSKVPVFCRQINPGFLSKIYWLSKNGLLSEYLHMLTEHILPPGVTESTPREKVTPGYVIFLTSLNNTFVQ